MKLILAILVVIFMIATFANANSSRKEKHLREKFDEFKKNFKHESDLNDEERFKNFAKNSDFIDSMNEKHGGQVKFEINKFADRDPQVHLKKMNGAKPPKYMARQIILEKRRETTKKNAGSTTKLTTGLNSNPITTKSLNKNALDWRTFNIVTPVKDQGYCGSCWAFASLAALESSLIMNRNQNLDLSEQNLVDCNKNNFGCNGGYIDYAFNYIKNGIMNEANYPYTGKYGICKFISTKSVAKVTSYSYFNNENNLENALINYGPIVTLLEVTDEFYSYKSGVMTGSLCTTGINHAVTVVGFNNTATPPYWIVKNSWGPDWGENGYFRIKKGSSTCEIGKYNYRPVL